jgi:hypothetical protein
MTFMHKGRQYIVYATGAAAQASLVVRQPCLMKNDGRLSLAQALVALSFSS